MPGKIWGYVLFLITGFAGVFRLIGIGKKSATTEVESKITKATLKQERASHKAMVDGLSEESEVRNEKIDTDNRDHFTRQ